MPIDPSYMLNEPSVGPVPAQTTVRTTSLSQAESAAGVETKATPYEELQFPLFASTVSQAIFIADDTYQVVSVKAVPNVIGGAGATVQVEKVTGTGAPGTGVNQLTAAIPLNGVAHTVLSGVVKAVPDTLNVGDRLGIVMAGTLTGLVGMIVVAVKRV